MSACNTATVQLDPTQRCPSCGLSWTGDALSHPNPDPENLFSFGNMQNRLDEVKGKI